MLLLIILAALVAFAIVSTVIVVARDGYRSAPYADIQATLARHDQH